MPCQTHSQVQNHLEIEGNPKIYRNKEQQKNWKTYDRKKKKN